MLKIVTNFSNGTNFYRNVKYVKEIFEMLGITL